jgi:uncharacterized protein YdeI (YjbR/CyaY-like superfamily)
VEITTTFYARDRAAWRAWLAANGQAAREIWLIFYKKHTGTPCVSYDEAVEEALCFGWIDGLIKRLDDDRYAQRFTPRKPGSSWLESNKVRVRKMIAEGRMAPAGLATVTFPLDPAEDAPAARAEPALSADLLARLQADEVAWASFNRLPPLHRRQYAGWIMDAARPETRQRRLEEAISKLVASQPLGMK